MATAKQLPSGNWRALAYAGKDNSGKRQYVSFTHEDKKEAEFLAAEFMAKGGKINSSDKINFQTACDIYITNKSNVLSPASIRGYRIMQRSAFGLLTNNITLKDIVKSDILQRQFNENAKKYKAKTLKNQFGFMRSVLNYHNIDIGKITLKAEPERNVPLPTKKDAEKIMNIIKSEPRVECQVLLALTCSLRQSEIAAIKAEDVDGNKIRIHCARVPDEHDKMIEKETNKSKAGTRTIVMPQYLSERVHERCEVVKTGLLFPQTPLWTLRLFQRALADNGMPKYTMHSLRHCFAAIMHAQNVPDKYVMEMGGWATDNVLKGVYQYTFEDEANKAKEAVNGYFDKVMQHEMQHK